MIQALFKSYFLLVLIAFYFATAAAFNLQDPQGEQQYVYLARSFLAGKTYFIAPESLTYIEDSVPYGGRLYWHMGPFPAVLLMPGVWLFGQVGKFFYQGYFQFFLTTGSFYLCYRLARKFRFGETDSLYLAFAFCFASVYQLIAFVPWVWYFAQAVTVGFTLLAIHEYLTKRRLVLVGVLMAMVLATRLSAGLAVIFFVLLELTNRNSKLSKRFFAATKLLVPVALAAVILSAYNLTRFGSLWDNGFKRSNLGLLPENYRYEQVNYGLFQLRNLPTNFYYYFMKTLDPIRLSVDTMHGRSYILQAPFVKVGFPGTSFLVVAPVFLYIFRARLKGVAKYAVISALPILFLLLIYYWPGWRQVGPRYMLDLLPLLYIVLLASFPKSRLPSTAKIIIIGSSLLDLYLFATVMWF